MLDLKNKIKQDLSGNLSTAQYLVAIKTDPVIYISTTKQMFQSTDGGDEQFGGNVLEDSGFDDPSYWSTTSGSSVVEGGKGKILGEGYGVIRKNNVLEIGSTYKLRLHIDSITQGEGGNSNLKLNLIGSTPTIANETGNH